MHKCCSINNVHGHFLVGSFKNYIKYFISILNFQICFSRWHLNVRYKSKYLKPTHLKKIIELYTATNNQIIFVHPDTFMLSIARVSIYCNYLIGYYLVHDFKVYEYTCVQSYGEKNNHKQLESVNFRNSKVHLTKQEKILPNSHRWPLNPGLHIWQLPVSKWQFWQLISGHGMEQFCPKYPDLEHP